MVIFFTAHGHNFQVIKPLSSEIPGNCKPVQLTTIKALVGEPSLKLRALLPKMMVGRLPPFWDQATM